MSLLSLLMKSKPNEPSSEPRADCPLCTRENEREIWRGAFWRLIDAQQPDYPGYMRLVLNRHVTEVTWLAKIEREQLFKLLPVIDEQVCDRLAPQKINIASLGNQVPHMHWHIIPRWKDDPHFPDSIWSPVRNATPSPDLAKRADNAQALFEALLPLCKKATY